MIGGCFKNIKKVSQLIEVLEKFDPDYDIRILDDMTLYGMNVIIPEYKNKVIFLPNKPVKKDKNKNGKI